MLSPANEASSGEMVQYNRGRRARQQYENPQKSYKAFEAGSRKMEHTLTPEEKRFILIVERGDTAGAAQERIPVLFHLDNLITKNIELL